jgi:hypothetical protein
MEPAELGIRDIEALTVPDTRYVGNDVCQTCHPSSYRKWLETQHSRAFVPLYSSMMAMMIGSLEAISADMPSKSGKCLGCHATAHDVPAAYRAESFRMGEGVSCEECHGPGEAHAKSMQEGASSGASSLRIPTEEVCLGCHREKPSHAMVCSNCHGARQEHVRAKREADGVLFYAEKMADGNPDSAGESKDESACFDCHSVTPSHMRLMDVAPFAFAEAWKKISHALQQTGQ